MRTVKQIMIPFFLFVVAAFSSCQKENMCDCIKRTGDIVLDKRDITGFDKIHVENNVNVFIVEDSVYDVRVEAGENIVGLVKMEVENHTLYIRNKNRCNWSRSYKKPLNVYLRMPKISYITSDGTGNIKSLGILHSDTIDVQTMNSGDIELTVDNALVRTHMFGSGDITLSGAAAEHNCSIGGTAYMYAGNLQTNYTYIHTFTLGSCYVNVRDLLICVIDDKGDIFCSGSPGAVDKYQHGTGQLYLQ